ncbi:MAG: DUF3078 domain-containing protein [Candidatus Latescibacterota bacterium]|nr:MAG: DUF3078 domain-containing protein [Candidatus Latescibacterota bacterium]
MKRSRGKVGSRILAVLPVAAVFLAASGARGADEAKKLEPGRWYPGLESGLNFTQSAYTDNWHGGDKGSIVWVLLTNGSLENQLNEQTNWKNAMKLAFGQTHQQERRSDGTRGWDRPEKSSDLIDLESILRFTLGWVVDPYVSGRFESQFQDVSDTTGRTIPINPLKFKESGGVARAFMKDEDRELLTRFGFTFRQSSRKFFVGPTGDETASETTNDGGLEWVSDYKAKVLEGQVSWGSKLTLYQPVFYSFNDALDGLTAEQLAAADLPSDVSDYPMTLDVDWENVFSTQITKYLSVNLYTRLIFDKYDNTVPPVEDAEGNLGNPADVAAAIRRAGQFKQTLSIGLTYRFL